MTMASQKSLQMGMDLDGRSGYVLDGLTLRQPFFMTASLTMAEKGDPLSSPKAGALVAVMVMANGAFAQENSGGTAGVVRDPDRLREWMVCPRPCQQYHAADRSRFSTFRFAVVPHGNKMFYEQEGDM